MTLPDVAAASGSVTPPDSLSESGAARRGAGQFVSHQFHQLSRHQPSRRVAHFGHISRDAATGPAAVFPRPPASKAGPWQPIIAQAARRALSCRSHTAA